MPVTDQQDQRIHLLPVVYQRKSVWQRSQDGKLRIRTHPVNDCAGPAACRKTARRAETIGEILMLPLQKRRTEERTHEIQSLMPISYSVHCLKTKRQQT